MALYSVNCESACTELKPTAFLNNTIYKHIRKKLNMSKRPQLLNFFFSPQIHVMK